MNAIARRAALIGALAATLPAVALGQHTEVGATPSGAATEILIGPYAVDPQHVSVLVGEHVGWRNASVLTHTVTSSDGLFDSGMLAPGRRFGYTYGAPGSFRYFCRIHPFIAGTVDVATLLVHPVAGPFVRGGPLGLAGRGAPGGGPITIERDAGTGFAALVTVQRAADGSFSAQLTAGEAASFRAVSGADVSAAVRVEVAAARTVDVSAVRRRGQRIVRVVVTPAPHGGTVQLQRHLLERFGWWAVARRSPSRTGRASFSLPSFVNGRVRVVLTKPDGETPVAVSRTLRLRG